MMTRVGRGGGQGGSQSTAFEPVPLGEGAAPLGEEEEAGGEDDTSCGRGHEREDRTRTTLCKQWLHEDSLPNSSTSSTTSYSATRSGRPSSDTTTQDTTSAEPEPSAAARANFSVSEDGIDFRYRLLGLEEPGLVPWVSRGGGAWRRGSGGGGAGCCEGVYPTLLPCLWPHTTLLMADRVQLRRDISLPYATSIMTGVVIGSGIFISPVAIIQSVGSVGLSLVMWAVAGLLTLLVVLCYAEMGAMFPRAGGDYAFLREVMGPLPAFLVAWTHLLTVEPGFYALLALTTARYLLHPLYPNCAPNYWAVTALSTFILVTVAALNSVYVRYVTRVEAVFTASKVLALLVIIVGGALQLANGKVQNFEDAFAGSKWEAGAMALALHSGVFTYSGWEYIFYLLEEMKRPEKLLPPAISISMVVIIVLYLLANVSYFTVMDPQQMMSSSAVAMTFGERALGPFALLVPLFVAFSTIGALNGAILGGSRVFFAAARDNLFPGVIAMVHRTYLTPWMSIWIMTLAAVGYVLVGDPDSLTMYLGFFYVVKFSMPLVCLLWLRYSQPDRHRPIKVPLVIPVVALVVLVSVEVLGVYQSPTNTGIGLLLVLTGLPVFAAGVMWEKPAGLTTYTERITRWVQKMFLLIPPPRFLHPD